MSDSNRSPMMDDMMNKINSSSDKTQPIDMRYISGVNPFIDEVKIKAYSNQGLHDISDVLYSLYEVRKYLSTIYLKEEDKHKKFNLYKDIEKLNNRIIEVLLIDE